MFKKPVQLIKSLTQASISKTAENKKLIMKGLILSSFHHYAVFPYVIIYLVKNYESDYIFKRYAINTSLKPFQGLFISFYTTV